MAASVLKLRIVDVDLSAIHAWQSQFDLDVERLGAPKLALDELRRRIKLGESIARVEFVTTAITGEYRVLAYPADWVRDLFAAAFAGTGE